MRIETDDRSGFCFGVKNAVEAAENILREGKSIYSLGQIVHNEMELERLHKLGLISVTYEQFRNLRDCTVLIRAHGEPPETYTIAKQNNITLIDATCPIVKRLQLRIGQIWNDLQSKGGSLVIFGKEGHAEVIGLMGQTGNQAILTDGKSNLEKIDYTREIHLFAQTTMNYSDYDTLAEKIRQNIILAGNPNPDSLLHIHRTICGQVCNRQPALEKFARLHDVIIFVSGIESSNGKMLFKVCKDVNPDTYFVSSPEELKPEWFAGKNSAGICGATSTPGWLIDNVKQRIESFDF